MPSLNQIGAVLVLYGLISLFAILVWRTLKSDQAKRDKELPIKKVRKRDARGRFIK